MDRGEGGASAYSPQDAANRGPKPYGYYLLESRVDFWIAM
jgi:hypothetical protein